ncbi:MAG: type VI secretion system protein IglI family protein [Methylococcaceae bacterium]|jgi:hypothetical protein
MKIELLQGSLPITENPGLDSTDPRLDEVATLSQEGQHAEAAALSEAMLADGVYDIRLICFFLFGYWLESGLASVLVLMQSLNNILLENWQAIGPENSRNRNLEKSLDWLFRQLLKKMQYEEGKKSALWQQWQAAASAVDMDEIVVAGESFNLGLKQQLDDKAATITAQWSKIEKWLFTFQELAKVRPDPELMPEEPDSVEDKQQIVEVAPMAGLSTGLLSIEISYPMALLLKKLAAFEQVLQDKKFPQAALLAEDINHSLATFDPKLYFPKLFETFVRLQVLNFEALTAYAEQQEDPQWLAMQEWLKVDIDSFIKH